MSPLIYTITIKQKKKKTGWNLLFISFLFLYLASLWKHTLYQPLSYTWFPLYGHNINKNVTALWNFRAVQPKSSPESSSHILEVIMLISISNSATIYYIVLLLLLNQYFFASINGPAQSPLIRDFTVVGNSPIKDKQG